MRDIKDFMEEDLGEIFNQVQRNIGEGAPKRVKHFMGYLTDPDFVEKANEDEVLFLYDIARKDKADGRYENAARIFAKVASTFPLNARHAETAAECYALAGDFEKALSYWGKAAALSPVDGIYYQKIGEVSLRIPGQEKRGVKMLEKASARYNELNKTERARECEKIIQEAKTWFPHLS